MEQYFKNYGAAIVSLTALALCRVDMGYGGLVFFLILFTVFIYLEIFYMRSELAEIYAQAVTENKILLVLLSGKFINMVIAGVLSVYLAFNLIVFIYSSSFYELLFFALAAALFVVFYKPFVSVASGLTKKRPANVFARVGVITTIVFIVVIAGGVYKAYSPVDKRIKEPFDIDIPQYVIEDTNHSGKYFQHLVRTVRYVEYNLQSVSKDESIGTWFSFIRFILLLSPAPYFAYMLLLLSFESIKHVRVDFER